MKNETFEVSVMVDSLQPQQDWDETWIGMKLHAMIVSVVAILFTLLESPTTVLVIGGILCTPSYFIIGLIEGKRSSLWFNPLSFYFLWYSIGLGLSAIYIGTVTASGEWISFSVIMIPPDNLAKAYVIFLIGSLAFHAGFLTLRPKEYPARSAFSVSFGKERLPRLIVMWAIGLWAGWNPALLAPLGAPGKIVPWLSLAALCIFALTPRDRFGLSKKAFVLILVAGTSGQFAANLMSLSKTSVMFSFFPLLWLFVFHKTLRRWLPVLGLALALFYFNVVAPLITIARQVTIEDGETQMTRIIRTAQGEVPVWTDYVLEMSYLDRIKMLLDRQFDPAPIGFLIEEVKLNGLEFGRTMEYITYAFIPRVLWPEKPSVTRGGWFATYTGLFTSEDEATTWLGMTPTGELYWNFGVLGSVVGMFLLGALLAGLWRMAGSNPIRHPASMVLYISVMLGLPYMAEAGSMLVSIIVHFLVFKTVFSSAWWSRKRDELRVAMAS